MDIGQLSTHGIWKGNKCEIYNNKKVLLHERKRHTTRHVASTRYAAPVKGVPLARGYPCWGVLLPGGVHWGTSPGPGWGGTPLLGGTQVPPISWMGYRPFRPGKGVPPHQLDGVPPVQTWEGGTPLSAGWGTPPGVNWHTNWKHYLPHPSDVGGKYVTALFQGHLDSRHEKVTQGSWVQPTNIRDNGIEPPVSS